MDIIFPEADYPLVVIISYGNKMKGQQYSYLVPASIKERKNIERELKEIRSKHSGDVLKMSYEIESYFSDNLKPYDFVDKENNKIAPAITRYQNDPRCGAYTSACFKAGSEEALAVAYDVSLPDDNGIITMTDLKPGSDPAVEASEHIKSCQQVLYCQMEDDKKIVTQFPVLPDYASDFCRVSFARAAYSQK